MVFKSDRQRKGFFGNQSNVKSNTRPTIMKRKMPILTKTERKFISIKIRKNIKEGKPIKQAIAIGFSQAREKFGKSRIPEIKNQKTDTVDKRTRNLLVTLLGLSIALSILRSSRS